MQIFRLLLGVILFVAPLGCNGNSPILWTDEALVEPSEDYTETPTTTGGNQHRQGQGHDSNLDHQTTVSSSGQTYTISNSSLQSSQGHFPGISITNPPSIFTDVNKEQLPSQVRSLINQTNKSVDLLNARINQMRQLIRGLESERDNLLRRMEAIAAEYRRAFQLSDPSNPNKPTGNRTGSSSQIPAQQLHTQLPLFYNLSTNTQIDPVPTSTSLGNNTDRFHHNSVTQSSPGGNITSYLDYYNRNSGSQSEQSTYPTSGPSRGTNRPSWHHQSNFPSSHDQTGGTYLSQSPIGNEQRLSSPYANNPYYPTTPSQGPAVPGNSITNSPSLSTDVGNEQRPSQVQSFIDQTSKSVHLLNARIKQMRHQGDTRHQQQIRDLERERDEQMRRMEASAAEYRRHFEQTQERQFNSSLQTLEEQSSYNYLIEELRRREMEKDLQHKALMESIKRQREQEEAFQRAKCSGWEKMKPWCW